VCKVVENTPLPTLPTGWAWGTPTYSPTGANTTGITIVKNTTTTAALVTVTNTASFNSGALTIGFWQNKNGQGIIKTYCGSSTANTTKLVNWLRTFAPFQDLASTTPCTGTNSVQSYVLSVIKAATCASTDKTCNAMLKAQMLATALNVYFSDSSLGGNLIGAFNGNGSNQPAIGNLTVDLSTICKENDGSGGSGTCSGGYSLTQVQSVLGPNGAPTKSTDTLSGSSLTVMQILINVAKFSDPGGVPTKTNPGLKWYNQVKSSQVIAKDVFDSINNRAVKFI